jgi:predicted transposase/invertase (TIGR01784 family)
VSVRKNPYDAVFRTAFSQPESARELALNVLPGDYAARLAGAAITVEPETLIDPELAAYQSDILIRAESPEDSRKGASPWYLYVLFEHKSYPDRWVSLQLLRYVAAVYAKQPAAVSGKLAEVVPVVIYHGTQEWRYPLEFADLVGSADSPAGKPPQSEHVPRFTPHFVNLADLSLRQLRGSTRTLLGLIALRDIKRDFAELVLDELLDVMQRALSDPAARDLLIAVANAFVQTKEADELRILQTQTRNNRYTTVGERVMTAYEEAIKQGMEIGAMRSKREMVSRLVARRFGLEDAERRRIERCDDPDALDAAAEEVVVAETKKEVLSKLPE